MQKTSWESSSVITQIVEIGIEQQEYKIMMTGAITWLDIYNGHRLSETVFVCLWRYIPVTFPPSRDVMNNSKLGSCDMNAEIVSLHVSRVCYLIAKQWLCSHSNTEVNTYLRCFFFFFCKDQCWYVSRNTLRSYFDFGIIGKDQLSQIEPK